MAMKNTTLKHKFLKTFIASISGVSIIASVGFGTNKAFADSDIPIYCEFSETQRVIKQQVLYDFGDNKFKLYELEDGYAIYSVANSIETFIEGSYEQNSPYFDYANSDDLRYLGPGNYLYNNGLGYTDIISNKRYSYGKFSGAEYVLNESVKNSYIADIVQPYADTSGFILVNHADYFKNLTYFPENWWGECGLIALSILLGYHDTFNNDNFIPNDKKYGARYYVPNSDGDLYLQMTVTENISKFATINYKDVTYYPYTDWSVMPGTSYAMRDYLFDNYMKTSFGIGSPDFGYPMLNGELERTVKGYMEANCPELLNKIEVETGNTFYMHKKVKKLLDAGVPTCMILQTYQYASTLSSKDGGDHIVVGYGYQGDRYVTHFGWSPNSKRNASVILAKANIQGYYTFKYFGEHVHSTNVRMKNGSKIKYICGCGYVQ